MRMRKKLRGRGGFTLAETLLAVLILLMVSSIVASGIPVAKNAYEKVVLGSNAQLLLSTAASALRNEIGTAREAAVEDGGLTYFSGDTGAKSKLYTVDNGNRKTIMLQEYVSVDGLNSGGYAGGEARPLVSNAAETDDLYVSFGGVEVSGGVVRFRALRVYRRGGGVVAELGGDSTLCVRPVSVKQ